jgi:hypothetical protein
MRATPVERCLACEAERGRHRGALLRLRGRGERGNRLAQAYHLSALFVCVRNAVQRS